jgi:hypothetical protein
MLDSDKHHIYPKGTKKEGINQNRQTKDNRRNDLYRGICWCYYYV